MSVNSVSVRLPARPESVAAARAALSPLGADLSGTSFDDARLLVSELVTNSLRHAALEEGAMIHMFAAIDGKRLRVEINDAGVGFDPRTRTDATSQESGWGLYLVDEIAETWGRVSDAGTTVWFELGTDRA